MSSIKRAAATPYAIVPELARFWDAAADASAASAKHGKRGPHTWASWGDDEKYERCAGCGSTREVAVKQGSMF